jgi:hypothetical protein
VAIYDWEGLVPNPIHFRRCRRCDPSLRTTSGPEATPCLSG